jgi:hypothetical protein
MISFHCEAFWTISQTQNMIVKLFLLCAGDFHSSLYTPTTLICILDLLKFGKTVDYIIRSRSESFVVSTETETETKLRAQLGEAQKDILI